MGLKCIAQMIGVFLFLEPKLCWYVDTSPFIHCGHELAIFPITIQCVSEGEARQVAGTLQAIIDSIPHGADYMQILAALDIPSIQTLIEDENGFYAIVIGSPPGIYHTV